MNGSWVASRHLTAMCLGLALAIGSCTSAEEVLNDGIELEAKGSYEEAAWKYIRALRKDDDLTEARERLQWVSDTLVTVYLTRAARAEDTNRPVEAAEAYLEIDRLHSGALEVGVETWLPGNYGSRRRDALDRAVAELEQRAQAARAERRFDRADDLLRDAVERFDPDPPTRHRLLTARFDVLLNWADDLSFRGLFREAVRRTDEALAIAETNALDPTPAIQLRNAALEAGTVYVAATPVWRAGRLGRDVSPSLLSDLNDRLELDFWSAPPEFVAFAHPALVRRRLRQLDLDRESLSRRDARVIARDLDADFAVIAEIDRFDVIEKDLRDRVKQARTKKGEEVVYTETEGRVEIRARLSYAIVDDNGNVVREGHADENRSADFKRAVYVGDYRDLDISRGTRSLFESDRYEESLERAEEELARRLAERLGQVVFDQVLSRVG